MTVMNGFTAGKRAFLYSDTAYTNRATGKVVGFGAKQLHNTTWPWAMSFTLMGALMEPIGHHLGRVAPKNLVGLIRTVPDALRAGQEAAGEAGSHDATIRAMIAAWCARTRTARLFQCATDCLGYAKPFEVVELSHHVSSGNDLPEYAKASATGFRPGRFDPGADMLVLIEAQRNHPIPTTDGSMGHLIGGRLMRTEVSRDGVEVEELHAWPDAIGERIKPHG